MNSLKLRLPATSANLGPGFDALGLALNLWLDIEAVQSAEFAIDATGRDVDKVARLDDNLILTTYRSLAPLAPALRLTVANQIPLGKGCGSSAAALLAGVYLANHFGSLGWSGLEILAEACRREGHPDNVAACFYGGLTASAVVDGAVVAATFGQQLDWPIYLAIPEEAFSTSKARALLPETYSRADAVQNIQATALLVAAFALNQPALLKAGTRDQVHQPYRASACPLFEDLLSLLSNPLASPGIYAVTLSGAGPSVLIFPEAGLDPDALLHSLRASASGKTFEFVSVAIGAGASVTER